jgi:hypothetical protein
MSMGFPTGVGSVVGAPIAKNLDPKPFDVASRLRH